MKRWREEAGFSLVELLVAFAITGMVLTLCSAALFQYLRTTEAGHDRLSVLRDHGTAFQWLNRDGQQAISELAIVNPSSVDLSWSDQESGDTFETSYAQSGDELERTLIVNGGTPFTHAVAHNVDVAGFSASRSGPLLTVSISSTEGGVAQTRTETVLMRVLTAPPTPQPTPTNTPTPTQTLSPTPTPTYTPTPTSTPTPASSEWLATGTYTGNDVDGRLFAGIGFQPDVVFIKSEAGRPGVVRTSTMAGDSTKVLPQEAALQSNRIQSITADGFTVGNNNQVNNSGETYHWIAIKAGSEAAVGTYVGNSADNRSIAGVGFQPVWVITLGDGENSWFRAGGQTGDSSFNVTGGNPNTNRIQAFEANGFQIGSNNDVNRNGTTFHYIALAAGPNVAAGSSYTGNGSDDRSISGVGFQPEVVWIKDDGDQSGVWRPASLSGDATLYWEGSALVSNRIQAIESDGFQIGTHNEVNRNGDTYYFLALDDGT
ncbi:MAG: prepilin-type N-terminal cleavage/methylation domain-containing protein [Dehalococcoidia bacterium]